MDDFTNAIAGGTAKFTDWHSATYRSAEDTGCVEAGYGTTNYGSDSSIQVARLDGSGGCGSCGGCCTNCAEDQVEFIFTFADARNGYFGSLNETDDGGDHTQ